MRIYGCSMRKITPIPADAEARIAELAPEARLARRQHGPDNSKVLASKELSAIFSALYDQGCSISHMAKAANMTYHSVSARIKGTGAKR